MKRKESTHSEDPLYGASSSSTSPHVGGYEGGITKKPNGNEYEVFLSFRGKDTRKGFTDYLYTSLVDAGIRVFRDDNELRVGEKIGPELLCSITQSKISIPIISEDYASSKWCLHELVHMLKCRRSIGQVVLPIFYKVEPSQVRHLTKKFGDAMTAHKEKVDKMVVNEWEEALKEVSSLKGWESEKIDDGHEGALVKIVVRKVIGKLKRHFQLIVPKELVGIDNRAEEIMSFIDAKFDDTRIIGIYGMGGIGKTTLARVLYNNLSGRFEHLSFVANIRETALHKGIEWLQNQLIHDILRSPDNVYNADDGIHMIKSRFTSKKVLILLDDMDNEAQLNALAGDNSWFKVGSIVIITTRNKSILDEARAAYMYELKKLPLDPSLILFSRHAFRKDSPPSDYEVISRDIVSTTGGLPLALEVIGSFLREKTNNIWKDTLKKLKKVPHKKVQATLMISYESLDYETKQIFLDISCFCIGSSKQSATYMWDGCEFFPENGIEELSNMSLIKIEKNGNLMMHDQLRDLGREIVRLENPKEPQKRSRLWICEEASDVLDNNKGTSKIEALRLRYYDKFRWNGAFNHGVWDRKSYRGEQFNELTNLRFLQVDGLNFTGDFQNLLPQLRWLRWQNCPSYFEVANFHPKKLVVLDLSNSAITENWGGWDPLKMATKLKVLDLSCCGHLRRTPDLSAFKSLKILILVNCGSLEAIHPSIWYIKTLVSLNVKCCTKLKEVSTRVGRMEESRELLVNDTAIKENPISRGCLMKPKTLGALSCDKFAQLPESTGSFVSLTQLNLSQTRIEELPESVGSMKALETLDANFCVSLARIPSSIGNLASLSRLDLRGCRLLREIPDSIGKLASLTQLGLGGTSITKLPESIGNLQNLRILNIWEIPVTELPIAIGMLAKLKKLSARWCKNLKGLPNNIGELVSLNELDLAGSGILDLPESISKLSSLQRLSLVLCENLRGIPEPPSSLTALHIDFPSPSLPFLSKLTLLEELTLFDCRPLECLPELPVRLSKVYLRSVNREVDLSHGARLRELIREAHIDFPIGGFRGLQAFFPLSPIPPATTALSSPQSAARSCSCTARRSTTTASSSVLEALSASCEALNDTDTGMKNNIVDHFLKPSHLDKRDEADFSYVSHLLDLSGIFKSEQFEQWQTTEQPLNPKLLDNLEDCAADHELGCSDEVVGTYIDHQLLFALVNEALLEIFQQSFAFFPKAFSFTTNVRPIPKGQHMLEEVWKRVNRYRTRPELDQTFDDVMARPAWDMAKGDGWLNLQWEGECIALKLEDWILDDLLDEVLSP